MEMAASEQLQIKEQDFPCDGVVKPSPRWEKCIVMIRDYVEK
jgi:hypothetical protein